MGGETLSRTRKKRGMTMDYLSKTRGSKKKTKEKASEFNVWSHTSSQGEVGRKRLGGANPDAKKTNSPGLQEKPLPAEGGGGGKGPFCVRGGTEKNQKDHIAKGCSTSKEGGGGGRGMV